jgi:carotenoid cleavage dioxygenase-like enzyme
MTMHRRSFLTAAGAASAALALNPDRLFAAGALGDWTLGVADVEADLARRDLTLVHGKPPAGLQGSLFRNGPAKFHRPGGSVGHWFDGDGMVRRFTIQDGRASLAARFVDTPKRRADTAANAVVTGGFGTARGKGTSIGSADDVNGANISVLLAGDELWALWEAGSPFAMDPDTLETRGLKVLRPDLAGMPFLAHPRYEPDGTVWNIGLSGKKAIVWRLSPGGAVEAATLIDLPRASYVHDFTATARHLVIVLQPWIQERLIAPLTAGYAWRPDLGTQILVIDKADPGKRRIFETDPLFVFHMGDAWEETDGTIRFDLCADADASFAVEGGAALVAGRRPAALARPDLRLYALRPDGTCTVERPGVVAEFPKADDRFAGAPRSRTAFAGSGRGDNPLFQSLGVRDWTRDRVDSFDFGPRHLVEEALFVPRPGGTAEMDGWLLGASINLDARASELHVFDARRVAAGPVCTWRADVALPISLHGQFKRA